MGNGSYIETLTHHTGHTALYRQVLHRVALFKQMNHWSLQ